jgi:apolipoprotein N-acyltransferase
MQFDLSAGSDANRVTVGLRGDGGSGDGDVLVLATPICFESAVASVCRRLIYQGGQRKADVLVNLTNDGWFNTMAGGREQHLQIGRFRCIENRVPMIRAANTGVSAAIDSSGRIVQYGPTSPAGVQPAMSEGVMVASIEIDDRLTMYRVLGDAFGWLCLGLCGLLIAAGAAARALRSEAGVGVTT